MAPAEASASSVHPVAPVRHLAHVDGLRGCAALFVMLHHMFQASRTAQHPETPRYLFLFQYGHFAVSLFIVISGFSLMLPVLRGGGRLPQGAKGFYERRARRILPPYYCAMAVSLAVIAAGVTTFSVRLTPVGVLAHVFLVQNAVSEAKDQVNNVFWSIAVESQIYLLFPLLGGASATAFATAYSAMIDHFAGLTSHPHIFLALPPAVFIEVTDPTKSSDCNMHFQILPIIRQVAAQKGLPTIDVYAATSGHPEYFYRAATNDYDVHPNDTGHRVIAQLMYQTLLGQAPDAGAETGGLCDGGLPPVMTEPDAATAGEDGGVSSGGGSSSSSGGGSAAAPASSASSGGCAVAREPSAPAWAWCVGGWSFVVVTLFARRAVRRNRTSSGAS